MHYYIKTLIDDQTGGFDVEQTLPSQTFEQVWFDDCLLL